MDVVNHCTKDKKPLLAKKGCNGKFIKKSIYLVFRTFRPNSIGVN